MSTKLIKAILLVEDNLGDARLLREMFNEQAVHGAELTHVDCLSAAEKHLSEHSVDIILLDLGLPDAQGLEAIRRVHAAAPRVPLVVLTGLDDESLAAQALQEGAQDYLIKGQIETRGILRALRYATERKRLERLKDEFVSTVSHELRTPLTSISGSLGLLMGNAAGNLPQAMARLLAIAHTNSQRLVRLVNDILDIEKMDAGQVVFNFSRVEFPPLVAQAIEANRGFAEGYGVRIRLDEACSTTADVRADPDRLLQVVTNLLSNAIKFSPPDNEVVVAIEKGTDMVRLTVRDHGPGIPADFKPLIFEKFAQADGTNARQKGGTGLGLSIVKQIVDRLSGEVGFADAPGGGTIFHVELPCWVHVANLAIDRGPNAARLLLCEDDLDTALTLRAQLKQLGFATDFAYSAADAFTRAAAVQYHAILVDIHLPDGDDGISLIVRLRELPQYSDTSIIVVSVDPSRGRDDVRSSNLNVLDWLSKPVDLDRLSRALVKAPVHDPHRRPRILHVDDDNVVARALSEIADVVTVNSIEEARRALKASDFDLAVLDMALAPGASPTLLPELRDSKGNVIPVVVFSVQEANLVDDAQQHAAVASSSISIDSLVATVRDRLASRPALVSGELV